MDINDSSLSRYKSNKNSLQRSASQSRASSDIIKSRDFAGSKPQEVNLSDLKDGQIVKGQILDHRLNEVKLQLEPGKQIVTAKLSGEVPLAIGQEASFQVVKGSSDQLILKYEPGSTSSAADSTVLKVLSASRLAATPASKALVTELLNNRMPVDKQTLQTLIRLSFQNRGASPLTLVLMYKNNIPITAENINQFEAYRNGTGLLLEDIHAITNNISDLLQQAYPAEAAAQSAGQNPAAALNQMPSAILAGASEQSALPEAPEKSGQAVLMNGKLIEILLNNSRPLSEAAYGNMLQELLSPEELLILGKAAEQETSGGSGNPLPSPLDIVQEVFQGTLSAAEAEKLLNGFMTKEDASAASALSKLQNFVNTLGENRPVLSQLLNPAERSALLEYLRPFPDPAGLRDSIENGTAGLAKLFSYLQESLSGSGTEASAKLLQSPEYHKLLENAFLQKWTLTPEEIAQKTPVKELYQNLREDIERLEQLAKAGNEETAPDAVNAALKNTRENLTFIKDLNELYTYLQLPVLFENKPLHSELYVYTDKKSLREKKGPVSVLLHLDMNNLGSLNIHLQMNVKAVQAKFYAEDKEAGQIIKKNIPLLEEALQQKGYLLQAELMDSYEKPDIIKELLTQNAPDHSVKHYTFDIRT